MSSEIRDRAELLQKLLRAIGARRRRLGAAPGDWGTNPPALGTGARNRQVSQGMFGEGEFPFALSLVSRGHCGAPFSELSGLNRAHVGNRNRVAVADNAQISMLSCEI